MKIKKIILSMALVAGSIGAAAQEGAAAEYRLLTLRTNAVLWAFGSLNVGVEASLPGAYTVSVDGAYGDWGVQGGEAAMPRLTTVGVQLRRYLSSPEQADRGWFAGVDGRYVHVNHQRGEGSVGKEGDLWNVGVIGGYRLPLGEGGRWAVDLVAGLGAIKREYDKYQWYAPAGMNRRVGGRNDWTVGLTTLEASVVYRF